MKEAAKQTKTNSAEIYAENRKMWRLDAQSQARVPPEPIIKRTKENKTSS